MKSTRHTLAKSTPCKCSLCSTGRKFEAIVKKLPRSDRQWMMAYYNASFEQGAELEILEAEVQ